MLNAPRRFYLATPLSWGWLLDHLGGNDGGAKYARRKEPVPAVDRSCAHCVAAIRVLYLKLLVIWFGREEKPDWSWDVRDWCTAKALGISKPCSDALNGEQRVSQLTGYARIVPAGRVVPRSLVVVDISAAYYARVEVLAKTL